MLLMIDNYDSFTYNLVQYFGELGETVTTIRNDQATLAELIELNPDHVVISPGPCDPDQAGISLQVIEHFAGKVPILGVCLGHQAIGEAFGAQLKNLNKVHHGVAIPIQITDSKEPLFKNIPSEIETGRYHSWVIDKETIPSDLQVTAIDTKGEVMAIRHKHYNVCGVQFHPESLLTPNGLQVIENWIR